VTAERPDQNPVEDAWRIHAALCDWTGKVDTKATFLSAIDVALLGGIVALRGGDHPVAELDGFWQNALFWTGVAALIGATLLVLWVVAPHLGKSSTFRADASENLIFFGHLQHWDANDLPAALESMDILAMLSRQLVAMGRIAWRKHRRLQLSVWATVVGGGLVALSVLIHQLTL
jgi:hypothetical protein